MKFFLSITFTILIVFSVHAKKYDIALNLEEGKTYIQNMHSEMIITQTYGGNKMKITMEINGSVEYLVKKAAKSQFSLDVKYTALGIKMDLPQAKMDFSSGQNVTDTVNNMMSLMFDNMVGKTFELVLTNKGKVVSVNGIEEVFSHLFDDLPNLGDGQKQQLSTQIEQAFGKDAFKQSMESSTAIFPENPVKVGESWTHETTMKNSMEFKITTVYTLEKVTDEYYLIKGTGTMESVGADYEEKNGMLMKQDLTGTQNSEISLDKNTGWVAISEVKQKIKGASFMKQTADSEAMEIPMELEGKTKITDK